MLRSILEIIRARPLLHLTLFAALILIPRGILTERVHSESFDAANQFMEGLRYCERATQNLGAPHPPFGQGIMALPFYLLGCRSDIEPILYVQPISIDSILIISAIWKSLLFLPTIPLLFAWTRRLYGSAAGLLAAALLLIDPTFAGFIPVGTLDSLIATATLAATLAWWRYFERPTTPRLALAAALLGLAVSIKLNAAMVALSVPVFAALFWLRDWRVPAGVWLRRRGLAVVISITIFCLTIWATTLFNYSRPLTMLDRAGQPASTFQHAIPAGTWVASVLRGIDHNNAGHEAFLLGEVRTHGWPYYFPVLLSYKLPPGMVLALTLSAASLFYRRLRREEASLLVPIAVGMALLVTTHLNIGFRHFMPVYIFMFPLAVRFLAPADAGWHLRPRLASTLAASAILLTLIDVLPWFPDFVPYASFGRAAAYRDISDSNIETGQSLKHVAAYLHANPPGQRPVYIKYFGSKRAQIPYYLGPGVIPLKPADPAVTSGILIISSAHLPGFFRDCTYPHLLNIVPHATIGHTMLVFDLDQLPLRGRSLAVARSPATGPSSASDDAESPHTNPGPQGPLPLR